MTQTYLEVHNLCKTFTAKNGSVEALKGVSLSIGKGEIFGVIGLSGAGKSTLVRCMNLLERPDSGDVLLNGESLLKLSKEQLRLRRQKIGMIFQHFNLLEQQKYKDKQHCLFRAYHKNQKTAQRASDKRAKDWDQCSKGNYSSDQQCIGHFQNA